MDYLSPVSMVVSCTTAGTLSDMLCRVLLTHLLCFVFIVDDVQVHAQNSRAQTRPRLERVRYSR